MDPSKEHSWILPRLIGSIWLGFKLETPGVMPDKNLDGTAFDFSNWKEGEPNDGEHSKANSHIIFPDFYQILHRRRLSSVKSI